MHIEDQEIDERDTHGLIPVVVVKPFEAIRTPCPPAGTRGEIVTVHLGCIVWLGNLCILVRHAESGR